MTHKSCSATGILFFDMPLSISSTSNVCRCFLSPLRCAHYMGWQISRSKVCHVPVIYYVYVLYIIHVFGHAISTMIRHRERDLARTYRMGTIAHLLSIWLYFMHITCLLASICGCSRAFYFCQQHISYAARDTVRAWYSYINSIYFNFHFKQNFIHNFY